MPYLLLILLLALPQRLAPHEIVDRVSEKYGHLDSLSADFEHILQDPSNRISHYRGHVYLKTGRRARYDYVTPEKKSEYFDGKTYTKFTPAIEQAIQMPISKADGERLAILQIVGNPESPWKNQFDELRDPGTLPVIPGNRIVQLIPRNKDLREVLIEVDPSSFLIYRLMFTKVDGEINEFRFTDIKTSRLDTSLFKFVPPPGVEVVKG